MDEDREQRPLMRDGSINTSSQSPLTTSRIFVLGSLMIAILSIAALLVVLLYKDPLPKRDCTVDKTQPPVVYNAHKPVHIKNAKIITGSGTVYEGNDLILKDGKISAVGVGLATPEGAVVYDATGGVVTPGLVDMHSHLGVYGFPEVNARQDGNEMTNPTLPQMRAIDAFDPEDPAIRLVLNGGVTTANVMPGSGNSMGGEAVLVKLKPLGHIYDMVFQNAPRAMKMACGENPKGVYGPKGEMPMSRMGNAWVMRRKFEQAQKLLQAQEDWCDGVDAKPRMPTDLSLDSMVSLLRGETKLHIHCYEVVDMEMAIRVAKEFNVSIAAFHHAHEAYKLAPLLAEYNITAALFADHWGYKFEAYRASVYAPKVLHEAGAKVAMKSDHPVLLAKDLLLEAQKAHFYGLPEDAAIASVTSVPAEAIGVGHRIGSIEVGKDADVVVWDRHPLMLGARPLQVYIEGTNFVDNGPVPNPPIAPSGAPAQLRVTPESACVANGATLPSYAVTGVTVYTMDNTRDQPEFHDATIVVQNGNITCIGHDCAPPADAAVFAIPGGVVIPGLIGSTSTLGQVEIRAESTAQDGTVSTTDKTPNLRAFDGIRFLQSKQIQAAWKSGVLSSVSHALANAVISGQSVAFHTRGLTVDDSLIEQPVAIRITLGNSAKAAGMRASVSGQIAILRAAFQEAQSDPSKSILSKCLGSGATLPVVAFVDQKDDIAALLRLKQEFDIRHLILVNAAEAWLLADKLAANQVSVIVSSGSTSRPIPNTWDTLDYNPNAPAILKNAGVRVGIGVNQVDMVRGLRWEAGLLTTLTAQPADIDPTGTASPAFTTAEAIAAVTSNIADMFLLPEYIGRVKSFAPANFLVLDNSGSPLGFDARIQAAALHDVVDCKPLQV